VWPPGLPDTVCPRPSVTLAFNRLTLKLVCETHLRWGTFIPNLSTLGLWVLELVAMCATDGQPDRQTDEKKQRLLPPSVRKLQAEASEKKISPAVVANEEMLRVATNVGYVAIQARQAQRSELNGAVAEHGVGRCELVSGV